MSRNKHDVIPQAVGLRKRIGHRVQRRHLLAIKALHQRLNRIRKAVNTKEVVFVCGLQRSGTNMLMNVYELSFQTQVFHESDPRVFENHHHRERPVVRRYIEASPAPIVVVKALLDTHLIPELLEEFAPAKAIWMFRHPDDTVNSIVKRFKNERNSIDEIAVKRDIENWRAKGFSQKTYEQFCRHYSSDINNETANMLFYYLRHRVFFDLQLDKEPRVYLQNYEALVQNPGSQVARLARFSGMTAEDKLCRPIHSHSVQRDPAPHVVPQVRNLAMHVYQELLKESALNSMR